MVNNLSKTNSIIGNYVAELRDIDVQKDSMRFRKNMERIGELIAYEISKTLEYEEKEVETPLGTSAVKLIKDKIVCATILRAGLPFHQGLLHIYDNAENAFITAYRKHNTGEDFEIAIEYVSSPDIQDKIVLLCDPMLASGASMYLTYKALLEKGIPKHTHIISIVSSTQGIDYIKKKIAPEKYTLWTAAVDSELTAKAYIVPGLGDAGDLAFGSKALEKQ
jgi:uracil phosphoribosyltransferase